MALHCPECGFVNPEGANYCQKCGAYLARPEGEEASTMAYKVGETGEYEPVDVEEEVDKAGAALVIRSGGGRAGESFTVEGDRMSIGRTPDAAVFLDDVTVSRNHALLVRRRDGLYIDDLGSLNGTYVNRRRIESHKLDDADEIQIRQELSTGDFTGSRRGSDAAATRRAASVEAPVSTMTMEELLDDAGVSESLLRELQEFGIVQPERRDGRLVYDETDLEIVRAAAELSRFGVAGRNLRVFRTSADREAALLQQIVGPALRSRSQARRKEAIENLESLAGVTGHLKHLLLVRDLRRLKGD